MHNKSFYGDRRGFLRTTGLLAAGFTGFSTMPLLAKADDVARGLPADTGDNIIGPKDGYSPQIGTLVSMMAWLRPQVVGHVKNMTTEQLDFLLDDKANTVGALLYHLAATDAFYHEHTFKGVAWGDFTPAVKEKFEVAMELGEEGRKRIRGNNLDFYLDLLTQTRQSTLTEFKNRDDKWLMTVDEKWPWGPTNNYCKWFHVCEHESHHLGQIAFLMSRIPGMKTGGNG